MATRVNARARTQTHRRGGSGAAWARYAVGRLLQIVGLLVTLLAATAYFGTPRTSAMLRTLLLGVAFFVPGWLLARRAPGAR